MVTLSSCLTNVGFVASPLRTGGVLSMLKLALESEYLRRVPLFSSSLFQFYWSYTNNGLKLAQLRFYQQSTSVAAAGASC